MKRIAIIENNYVRDTQIFPGDPNKIDEDMNWWNDFIDVKYPCHYVGVFDGMNEEEIQDKAAEYMGVHRDVITLVDVWDNAEAR